MIKCRNAAVCSSYLRSPGFLKWYGFVPAPRRRFALLRRAKFHSQINVALQSELRTGDCTPQTKRGDFSG